MKHSVDKLEKFAPLLPCNRKNMLRPRVAVFLRRDAPVLVSALANNLHTSQIVSGKSKTDSGCEPVPVAVVCMMLLHGNNALFVTQISSRCKKIRAVMKRRHDIILTHEKSLAAEIKRSNCHVIIRITCIHLYIIIFSRSDWIYSNGCRCSDSLRHVRTVRGMFCCFCH